MLCHAGLLAATVPATSFCSNATTSLLTPWLSCRQQALRRGGEWRKSDLLDVLFWSRIAIALTAGLIVGSLGITGFQGFMGYITTSILLLQVYYLQYLRVDDDEMGKWDLMTEGFVPSMALFVLTWSTVYSIGIKQV